MNKGMKGIIFLLFVALFSACSNQESESFKVFDDSQNLASYAIMDENEAEDFKTFLNNVCWSIDVRPDREPNFTIMHEKEGQSELINNYNVWFEFEDNRAIISDNFNAQYATLDAANTQTLYELIKIEVE